MPRLALACLLAITFSVPSVPTQVAPGCPSNRPTFFNGTIRGYPDRRALNTHIGITLRSSSGRVLPDGSPNTGFYAAIFKLNPNHPPTGLDTGEVTWGICVARSIIQGGAEFYPKRPGEITDESRYGSAAHYRQPVTPGTATNLLLRLPVTWQAARGNTGGVHGYVWYGTRRVPPDAITRVRAFTTSPGSACGIEGLSASADELAAGTGGTYYRVDYLAAGQCHRPYQTYSLQMDCTGFCGAARKSIAMHVRVTKGQRPRVDVRF